MERPLNNQELFHALDALKLNGQDLVNVFNLIQSQKIGAVYWFHEYIIGKDIIQKEDDQAFNYGRLHKALDAYIKELNNQKTKLDTTEEG